MGAKFFKVIACEIACREIWHVAAKSRHILDLEFLTQGLHDHPTNGCLEVQKRVEAVPDGQYDAILIGYALCGNIIKGLRAIHTPLVIPRAHDCITFLLGSRERYEQLSAACPGAYYYSSGWLECLRRRGTTNPPGDSFFLPTRAGVSGNIQATYEEWVKKYGEDQARYLMEVMDHWTANYTHGILIDFKFTKNLHLRDQVEAICTKRNWEYDEVDGDLGLLRRWLDGDWSEQDFLVVPPGQEVMPSYQEDIIQAKPSS